MGARVAISGATAATAAAAFAILIAWKLHRKQTRRRTPAQGRSHREHVVTQREAERLTAEDSLIHGHSVFALHDLATISECEALGAAAAKVAFTESQVAATDPRRSWWSVPEAPGRLRLPVAVAFGPDTQTLCEALLLRALSRIREHLPPLLPRLFGTRLEPSPCLRLLGNEALYFSPREPAINHYTARGRFKPHHDHESLTIIIPLNGAESFDGGGTAFWSCEDLSAADDPASAAEAEPRFVLVPPPGTALVFSGCVTHAAVRLTSGERCVLVCSFSPAAAEKEEEEAEEEEEEAVVVGVQ